MRTFANDVKRFLKIVPSIAPFQKQSLNFMKRGKLIIIYAFWYRRTDDVQI